MPLFCSQNVWTKGSAPPSALLTLSGDQRWPRGERGTMQAMSCDGGKE